jgi:hypothetical protein
MLCLRHDKRRGTKPIPDFEKEQRQAAKKKQARMNEYALKEMKSQLMKLEGKTA